MLFKYVLEVSGFNIEIKIYLVNKEDTIRSGYAVKEYK